MKRRRRKIVSRRRRQKPKATHTPKRTKKRTSKKIATKARTPKTPRRRRSRRNCCQRNPLLGVITNPSLRRARWADLPASVRADKRARRAATLAARFHGVPLAEVVFERVELPIGASPFQAHVGDEVETRYRAPKRSRRHLKGTVWAHAAGDHGRGKKRTKPAALVVDPVTGVQWFLSRRGSRRRFSSRRGLVG